MAIIPGTGAGAEQLKQFVERIERLEEEKRALMADIKMSMSKQRPLALSRKLCARSCGCEAWTVSY